MTRIPGMIRMEISLIPSPIYDVYIVVAKNVNNEIKLAAFRYPRPIRKRHTSMIPNTDIDMTAVSILPLKKDMGAITVVAIKLYRRTILRRPIDRSWALSVLTGGLNTFCRFDIFKAIGLIIFIGYDIFDNILRIINRISL